MSQKKVKFPISLQIVLLCIIPLIIVTSVSSLVGEYTTTKNLKQSATQLAEVSTGKLSAEVNILLTQYYGKVKSLADMGSTTHDPDILDDVAIGLTSDLYEGFSLYYATAISRFEPGGFYVDSSNWQPPADWNPPDRDWYKNAVATQDALVLTEPYVDAMTNSLCVTVAKASVGKDGTLLGVAAADIVLDTLVEMISDYRISENSSSYLVDSKGFYLTHKDPKKLMKSTIFDDYPAISQQQVALQKGKTQSLILDNQYLAISPVEGTPWFLVGIGELTDFTDSVKDTVKLIIIIMVAQLGLAIASTVFFALRIKRTFTTMVEHCNKFSTGDFTANFDEYFIAEANSLSKGFETFSQNIRMLVGKIFNSASSVSEMSKSLSQASESIKTSVGDTVSAISQIDSTSSHQTSAVQQVDDAVNEIVGEAQELSKEIDSQNQIISYSSASIEEIVQSMDSVHKHINEAAGHVEELVKLASDNKNAVSLATQNIVNVRKESASLQEMNNVISSVAAQTNLLAMNAAIEAAHAGAAGKGFAVVADEIRKLAETAAKQANSSSTYLRAIQEKIDGIAESAVSIDKSFTGTIQRINDISQVVTQLEQSTAEQEMLSGQVLQALNDIQGSTHNITTNVNGITASTSQTSQLCHKLRSLNEDVNAGISVCKKAATQMQNASMTINVVANSTKISVSDLLEAVSSFHVERRKNTGDRRQRQGETPAEGERRRATDRRKEHVNLTPPTLS